MGKKSSSVEGPETLKYISPISKPLFDGKLLERSVKLVRKAIEEERALRAKAKESGKSGNKAPRLARRGVAEVTKALRKGEKGAVFLAADVFPVDIISHLPIFCEEKDVAYGFVGSKQSLGAACKSSRPTSVVMIVNPPSGVSEEVNALFEKVVAGVRKANPYFD